MSAIDLRFSDYIVLATLLKEDAAKGLPVSRLAELALRPMGSFTQVIDRLVRRELVHRHPDPSDRRMMLIALTKEGKKVATEGAVIYDRVHARVLEDLAAKDVSLIDAGVRELLSALEADHDAR